MADIKGVVTKKIGPLPVWMYVVGGAAAVFLLGKFKGGGKAGGGDANTIRIPTFAAGSGSSVDDGAVGSPGQNGQGGEDTQRGGTPPWWASPPPWWGKPPQNDIGVPGPVIDDPVQVGGNGNTGVQSSASAGRVLGKTAAELAAEPAGGWTTPPVFQQTSPTNVRDTTAGKVGGVNPLNRLLGYADPVTGNLSQTPNGGPAIWA